jgi:hypothetical protein
MTINRAATVTPASTYGPFVLAYLETPVGVADWRASGGRELPVA